MAQTPPLAWMKSQAKAAARRLGLEPARVDEELYASVEWTDFVNRCCGGLERKQVLEVGCDVQGKLAQQLAKLYNPASIVGINPLAQPRQLSTTARIQPADIRRTNFDDCAFDIIVSSSAFEHIQDLDIALNEMYRVLKP